MKKQYVVIFYPPEATADKQSTRISIVSEEEVWGALDSWHRDGSKVVLYELGKCLLDWS